MIAIIDYGMGNLRSLSNAFEYLGEETVVSNKFSILNSADGIVLPGVGAFGDAMSALHDRGIVENLNKLVFNQNKPFLGICLGMQLIGKESTEHGVHKGLGWIDSHVDRLAPESPLKVPHVGWNSLDYPEDDWLFRGVRKNESNFYFVHSYHMVCENPNDRLATTNYGEDITAIVRKDNIVAMQFHPEKSQDNGLKVLQNWLEWIDKC